MLNFKVTGTMDHPVPSSVPQDTHWTETSLTGVNILLLLLTHSNPSFCGQASVRIHSLLNCRPLTGCEEAAYLLSSVNQICSSMSITEGSEHYAYLIPLVAIIVDKSYDLLQMDVRVPHVPLPTEISATLEDLRKYILAPDNAEWQNFIQQTVNPLADHYRSMSMRLFHMNMTLSWNHCHEMMLMGARKRNQQIGLEKLRFQVTSCHGDLAGT